MSTEAKFTIKQVTIGPELIAPGEIRQLAFQAPDPGRVKGAVVGEGARPVKLWVGKETFEVPEGGDCSVDLPVNRGQFVMLTVKNVGEEPGLFKAAFSIEVEEKPVSAPIAAVDRVIEGLSQKLPPEPKMSAADLGVKAGKNEIAVCFTRNEALFLIDSLRTGNALVPDVKYTIIRRLDDVLKATMEKR